MFGSWVAFLILAPHAFVHRRWGWTGVLAAWTALAVVGGAMGVASGKTDHGELQILVGGCVVLGVLILRLVSRTPTAAARMALAASVPSGSVWGSDSAGHSTDAAAPASSVSTEFGPNGAAIVTFIEQCSRLTVQDFQRIASCDVPREMRDVYDNHFHEIGTFKMSAAFQALSEAGAATRTSASEVPGRRKTLDAAHAAIGEAARGAWMRAMSTGLVSSGSPWEYAVNAGDAIAVSDLISGAQFATLTKEWREAGLPLP